jgi:hypothetical protein
MQHTPHTRRKRHWTEYSRTICAAITATAVVCGAVGAAKSSGSKAASAIHATGDKARASIQEIVGPHADYGVERPITPYVEKAFMFWQGAEDEWESRVITVPLLSGGHVVACFQTHEETATAECFYRAEVDGQSISGMRHIILHKEDVVI